MNILSEIIAKKRQRLVAANKIEIQRLAREARSNANSHALINALRNDGINVIAEFKRRSPSKGIIRPDADLVQIVQGYEAGGATAISVLTEEATPPRLFREQGEQHQLCKDLARLEGI